MPKHWVLLITVQLLSFVLSKELPQKECKDNEELTDLQKRYLDEIQIHARKGGMPEEEWKEITQFDKEVCYEIDCLESALEVMQSTNFSVNPCGTRKWLEFACARRVNGPDNINQLEKLIKIVSKQTLGLLEESSGKYDNDFLFKEAQTHFYQCLHKAEVDDQDVMDIMNYAENYGNWPVLTNKDPGEKFNWLHMLADLNRIERPGYNPYLLEVSIPEFFKAAGPIELNIGRTIFHVSNKDLISMLTLVQNKLGRKKPVRIDQIVQMLTLVTNVTTTTVLPDEPKVITIKDLQVITDQFLSERKINQPVDWLSFFKRVFKGVENINVTPELEIKTQPSKVMGVLLAVFTALTSKEKNDRWSVANLLHFQLVSTLIQEGTTLLDDKNSFRCVELSGNRKEICLGTIQEVFGYSMGATYVKAYYDDEMTPIVENIVNIIKKGYVDIIGKTSWMEDKTRKFLIDKVTNIKTFIAYPEWIKSRKKLAKFFKGLELPTDKNTSYPMNYLTINTWRLERKREWSYKYLNLTTWKGFPLYDVEWNHYPATVQAQYHKAINEARVEAGVIQKPIFGKYRPGFMNFGGLGMIVAHEFGHSFDIIGRMFNKNGENEKEYWDETSLAKYYEWVQQIADHYGSESYILSESSEELIDPWKSVNEDVADVLGLYVSFLSYLSYLKDLESKGGKEKILPGLKRFTPSQLFYLKYSKMWCDNKNIQEKYNDLLGDHSSGNTRATLPLKYSRQFAKAFSCKTDDSSD